MDWEGEGKVMPDFAKLENQQRLGAQQEGDLPLWAARQQKVFTNWINNKVCDRPLSVCDLFVDLQDGTVLYGLLEVLSKQSLAVLGRVKPEKNKIKKIANMNIVWKYLGNTVKLVGIGPTDIVDGNVTLTLGMIWSLIVFFMAKDLGDAGDGLSVLKKRIMEWLTRRTAKFPDVDVTNFTSSLADGRALLAVLNDYDPTQSPYEPSDNPADNLRRAFEDFRRLYGVGSILDPDDPQCCAEEKANITYLAELMKAMPDRDDEDGEGARRLETDAPVADTRKAAVQRAGDLFPETVGRLKDLCAFGPNDGESCAAKVAEMMTASGLDQVKVVKPSGAREDASMSGDPFVVGEKAGGPGTPTVLFYASYGTVDESKAVNPPASQGGAAGAGSPHQGSSSLSSDGGSGGGGSVGDKQSIERWASDPLCLTCPDGSPQEGSMGARLAARGAAQDKANVACQIAAVEALLKGAPPCGVKIVVGATPPPGSLSGNACLEVADRLADFLRAHPSVTGLPDLVVVSEPAGASLAPEKHAVLVGCRGFATLEVAVSAFGGGGEGPRCAEFGGPLIDPARVLTNMLASLHDPETGQLKVEGISDPLEAALVEGLRGMQCSERQLRAATGYSPSLSCAREVYRLEGADQAAAAAATTYPATIPEQLALLPAVTVTSISTTPPAAGGQGAGLLGSRFPATATAALHVCIPPGAEYATAIKALQKHCTARAPHGAKVQFSKAVGRAGWIAPTSSPVVAGVLSSLRGEGDEDADDGGEDDKDDTDGCGCGTGWGGLGRETVMASSPDFSAVPSAFARALPASAVLGLGVNDPNSKGGAVNESVLVDDLKDFVQGAVRLVHGVAKSCGTGDADKKKGGGGGAAGEDSPTAYSKRFIDDLDRRNAVNQLRGGRLSNVSSPTGSANTSPRGTSSPRGITKSGAGGSPVRAVSPSRFSALERSLEKDKGGSKGGVGGGPLSPPPNKHPLSPSRPNPSTATAPGLSPNDNASAIADLLQSSPLGPRVPLPPAAPSAAMAAFAAAALGGAAAGRGPGGGAGMGGMMAPPAAEEDDDDDKVGGGTPETVLAEINELRSNPKAYATKLEALQEFYDKSMYNSPTGPPVQTTEGVKPLVEVIAMLKTTAALEPLESKEGMQQAAADHVQDLAGTSRTGHSGSDGSGAADRMNRYGQFFQVAGEVCTYFDATAEGIVAQLLVSDGERSRHNRKALLATHFKVCGIAIGTHPTVGAACVITLAGGYGPRPLARAADVTCEAGEAPSAEFREVLESIPVPQITEEVHKCVRAGMKVQLQYSPGSIKCTFVQSTGARKSMGCTWA
eukprot:g10491.t1